jgi:hypothetical protein
LDGKTIQFFSFSSINGVYLTIDTDKSAAFWDMFDLFGIDVRACTSHST